MVLVHIHVLVTKEKSLKCLILHCYRVDLVCLPVTFNHAILHEMHLDQLFYHLYDLIFEFIGAIRHKNGAVFHQAF